MHKPSSTGYFSFTRKERTGIFLLSGAILVISFLPRALPWFYTKPTLQSEDLEKDIAALKIIREDSTGRFRYRDGPGRDKAVSKGWNRVQGDPQGELFPFDPNTLSPEGWKKLGIRDKTIQTIQRYVSKGGHFRIPEDIEKIWGLSEAEVKKLMPYVSIKQETKSSSYPGSFKKESYRREIQSFDINTADTTAFISLPGIGSKLAARIVAFREKLGGFTSVNQVAETYALPDSTFQKIRKYLLLNQPAVRQININQSPASAMRSHPYIRQNLAAAIIEYRERHGKYKSVPDIKKIMMVTDELFAKLAPYLTVE